MNWSGLVDGTIQRLRSQLFVRGQFLDDEVPILDSRVRPAVDLKGHDSVPWNGFIAHSGGQPS